MPATAFGLGEGVLLTGSVEQDLYQERLKVWGLFPHLTHLAFSTVTNEMDFISPTEWHQFISTNLLELTQLRFHIEIKGQ